MQVFYCNGFVRGVWLRVTPSERPHGINRRQLPPSRSARIGTREGITHQDALFS